MNGLQELIETVAAKAEQPYSIGDYQKDGLLHCGKCRTPKQTVVELFGEHKTVGCMCRCMTQKREAETARRKEQEQLERIHRLRVNGIADRSVRNCTFASADGSNREILSRCRRYSDRWPEMLADNIGLLFWGNTGNGKTHAAACIANALIDRGVPVLMTNFPKILGALTGLYAEERISYLESLSEFPLLVIDDLGAERQSEFALEQVYAVIDSRYKSKLPLIITTNLSVGEMKNPKNMDYQRIYDRVLEMCVPLHFKGESLRRAAAAGKLQRAKELFGGE